MAIVREEYPECFVTTSSSVSPQFREFERFTTTAMNAFVGPKVRNYVTSLESDIEAERLQGRPAHHGVERRRRHARRWSPSGRCSPCCPAPPPACSAATGRAACRAQRNLITFDIGGTSADIGIVDDGGFGEATRARHLDRGLPRAGADDRHAHDRRRRRLDRLRRPGGRLQGRPALGRRRAGTGRLRPRRQPRRP